MVMTNVLIMLSVMTKTLRNIFSSDRHVDACSCLRYHAFVHSDM